MTALTRLNRAFMYHLWRGKAVLDHNGIFKTKPCQCLIACSGLSCPVRNNDVQFGILFFVSTIEGPEYALCPK